MQRRTHTPVLNITTARPPPLTTNIITTTTTTNTTTTNTTTANTNTITIKRKKNTKTLPLLPRHTAVPTKRHPSHHSEMVPQPLLHGALERHVRPAKHKGKVQPEEQQIQAQASKPARIGV